MRSMVAGTTTSPGTLVAIRAAANGTLPLSTSEVELCAALVDAKTGARIALRVEVEDQHAFADGGKRGAEIDRVVVLPTPPF